MAGGIDFKKVLDPLGLFTKTKAPAVQAAPVQDTSAAEAEQQRVAEEERKRSGAGRASTILTSPLGDTTSAPSATKMLMGA